MIWSDAAKAKARQRISQYLISQFKTSRELRWDTGLSPIYSILLPQLQRASQTIFQRCEWTPRSVRIWGSDQAPTPLDNHPMCPDHRKPSLKTLHPDYSSYNMARVWELQPPDPSIHNSNHYSLYITRSLPVISLLLAFSLNMPNDSIYYVFSHHIPCLRESKYNPISFFFPLWYVVAQNYNNETGWSTHGFSSRRWMWRKSEQSSIATDDPVAQRYCCWLHSFE